MTSWGANRLLEATAPARLGRSFRLLVASSWLSSLGDGIVLAGGPLLVHSETGNAVLIALASTLQQLPYLLFGLLAGALSDRHDRKRIVVTVDCVRAVVLALVAVSVVTHSVSIALLLLALFVLGTADVFGNNAGGTLLPMLVPRDDLALGNARIQTGFVTLNQLVGPALGAALFASASALPLLADAALAASGAVLMSRIVLPPHGKAAAGRTSIGRDPEPNVGRDPEHGTGRDTGRTIARDIGRDIVEGFVWVRHHAAVRTLVLTIFIFNITFGAAWSVLVLYASDRLHLGAIGYGLLTTVSAGGGLVSTVGYVRLVGHVSLANLMKVGLIIETFTHLGLALTTRPWVAMVIFFVFGAHAFVWGATSSTVRQRAVPLDLQGRVNSVNLVGVFGGLVVGSTLGGVLARHLGVTAPFWFAFAGSAVFVVAIWPQLRHIAHDDANPSAV